MALMKKVWAVAWIVLLFGALHVNGEEDNPCRHPEDRREGDGITGEITILATQTVKLEGQCGSSVDICSIAKGAVNYNDTVRQKWKCGVCGDRLASTRPADHDVTKSASHYPGGGDGPVTGAGTYRVSVSASCSCCGKSDSTIVTVVIEHTFDNTDNCDVSLLWYNDPSTDPKKPKPNASPNCPYPESQVEMQNLCYQTGNCKTQRVCTVCGEEAQSTSNTIENKKSARTEKANSVYVLTQTVGCKHVKDTRSLQITVQHEGNKLENGSRNSCHYEEAPGTGSEAKNITIPVGDTRRFNVAFTEKQRGYHEYTKYLCRRCSLSAEFEQPLRVPHSPEAELPPSPGSGELLDPQPPNPYHIRFDSSGDTKVTFKYLCESRSYEEITHEGMTFTDVTVPGCSGGKAGEFEFDAKVVTVSKVEVTSTKATGSDSTFVLPELPAYEPAPTEKVYVKPFVPATENSGRKWETVLRATPSPEGGWPEGWPSWTRYPQFGGSGVDPLLLPVDGQPALKHSHPTEPGAYIFVARCGIDNKKVSGSGTLQPNPNHAKSIAVYVVDPQTSVKYSEPQPVSCQELYELPSGRRGFTAEPCDNIAPVEVKLSVVPNGLPDGLRAEVRFDSPQDSQDEVFEVYRDIYCTEKVDKNNLSWTVNSENLSKTYYVKVLGPKDKELFTDFTISLKYQLDENVAAPPAMDTFQVMWNACGSGSCSAGGRPGAGMDAAPNAPAVRSAVSGAADNSGGLYLQMGFGGTDWGKSGGGYGIRSRRIDISTLSPEKLTFGFAAGTAVKYIEPAADEPQLLKGYPRRVVTGRYQTEFEYSVSADEGGEEYVSGFTAAQYISSNMDLDLAAAGTPDSTMVVTLQPDVSLSASYTRSGETCSYVFTEPQGACPDMTGACTLQQLTENGVTTILASQIYLEDGVEYQREIRYIGSMTEPVAKTDTLKRKFSWGFETVSETAGGETTTYEYYENGPGRLKKVTYYRGDSVSYVYDDQGRVTTATQFRGGRTIVTANTYSLDTQTGARTADSVTTEGEVEISRSRSVDYAAPGDNPTVYTRYGDDGEVQTTQTWLISDPASPFRGRTRRQIGADGRETRYGYERSGDAETVTTEQGVFVNDVLMLGTRSIAVSNRQGAAVSNTAYFIDTANGVNVKTAESINTAFDAHGRPTVTQYMDGTTTTTVYGCCGVESETDRSGMTTTYAYDAAGRLDHAIRDGITTFYTYDQAGNLLSTTVTGRDGGEITTSSSYVDGRLAASADALGNVTTYSYSVAADTVTGPDGSTQVTSYSAGEMTGVSGTAVRAQTYEYGPNWQRTLPQGETSCTDKLGRQYKTVYADGSEAVRYYNAKSQVVKSVTPAGRVTLYEYDALGRQVKQAYDMNANGLIDAADLVTITSYGYGTESGKTVSITVQSRVQGENLQTVSTEKQSLDGLESWSTDGNGLTTHTKTEYLGGGQVRRVVTSPDGSRVTAFSVGDRTMTVTNTNADGTPGSVTNYAYDEFNRPVTVGEAVGTTMINMQNMTYDAAGQVLTQTVNGRTTSYAYDVLNRKRTVTLPGGRVIVEEYFPTGELKKISGADTYTQEWTYDPVWGQKATLTTYKDASTPQVTGWTYNNRGFNIAKSYPDGTGPSYSYDADGKLLTRTWARGLTTTYAYDAAGRLTGQSYSDGTPSISRRLDFLDRMTQITDAAGTRTFTWTDNVLTQETVPYASALTYAYDAQSRRTGIASGDYAASVGYANGKASTLGWQERTTSYTYRPGLNQLSGFTTPGTSTARTFEYDAQHRLTEIKLNGQLSTGYTLNEKDQRIRVESEDGSYWKFTYDGKSQVTAMERRRAGEEEQVTPGLYYGGFSYDDIGNWTETSRTGTTYYYLTSNILNQYTDVSTVWPMNTWNPTYDADGNMLTGIMGWSYGWNDENRLISAENGDTRLEFSYDYMGRRFKKKVYTANVLTKHEKFVYDGYKLIQVLDALNSDAVTMAFAWHPESTGLDTPFSMTYDGETYYYVTDGNKNVMSLIDAAGTKAAEYVYDPFGRLLSSTGELAEINPFRFSSEYHDDETGLVYYNYRYYSPELGRWISRDPIEEEGGVNLYAMVGNNPVNRWDHLGFSFWNEFWNIYERMEYEKVKRRVEELYLWFKDDEGYLIFERWALGKGDWLNAPFGDYLKKSIDLQAEMRERLAKKIDEVNKLVPPGEYVTVFKEDSFVLSDNRYRTGYELLHGTNWTVGGFRWYGQLYKKSPICFEGDINYEWNDIIDPNYDYDFDFIDVPLRVYLGFVPRNYTIKIKFSGKFQAAYYANRESWSFTGEFPAIQRER